MSEDRQHQDRWEVQQLICRYCELVDLGDWDSMSEVFTVDHVGVYNGMEVAGLDLLIANARKNMVTDKMSATLHNVLNFRITLDGDSARCVSNYYALHRGAAEFEGQIYRMWGVYDDKLVRTESGWRIAHRDYTTVMTEGDERMTFNGEDPTWNELSE
ncbi:MAG: nuclear transport factor 2 family protein [Pseudomonadota bacterium]